MERKDTWIWSATVDGTDLGIASGKEGGNVESEGLKRRPGGMLPERSLGSVKTRTDSTVKFPYVARLHELVPWLETRCGKGAVVLSGTPLDADGNRAGRVRTMTGKLKSVTAPDYDAGATDEAADLEIVVEHDEEAT